MRAYFNRSLTSPFLISIHISEAHPRSSFAYSANMSSEGRAVYLEDLETPAEAQQDASKENKVADSKAVAAATVSDEKDASAKPDAAKTGIKRQRTLMDMFTSTSGSGTTQPSAKKIRLEKSGSSSSVSEPSRSQVSSRTLNSIPFSPSEFLESLSEDEKRLLALEVATMGKSW
jgi:uracil-DNA glycosylase